MSKDVIIHQEAPTPELERIIQEGLQAESPQGPSIGPSVAFTIKDTDNAHVAAIVVKQFWGALHIKNLWTHPDHRKKGFATQLIQKAEDYALSHQLSMMCVETFSFQALGFYQKVGFPLDFTREGYAQGASFHYLSKKVGTNKSKAQGGKKVEN